MKYEIIVYKSPLSDEVMAQFYTPELFTYWVMTHDDLVDHTMVLLLDNGGVVVRDF